MANRDYNRGYGRTRGRDFDRDFYGTTDWDYNTRAYDRDYYYYNPGYYNPNWDVYNTGYANPDWDTFNTGNYSPSWDDYNNRSYTPEIYYYEYWWTPGPFTGYGPTNYQRSDERIRDDVNERLTRHGRLDARNIDVDVDEGVVTLTGSVPSRREKRLAEDIVDSVFGVVDVQNQLQVTHKRGQGRMTAQTNCGEIRQGMEVVGSQGKHIGTVKEIRSSDFLVDRNMAFDVFVPFSACDHVNGKIFLNVKASDIDKQGWPTPESSKMAQATNR